MRRPKRRTRRVKRPAVIRLKTRLWLTFTALLVGATTPLILLGVLRMSSLLHAQTRNEAVALAKNIAYLSVNSLLHFNYFDLDRITNEATRENNVRYVVVFDRLSRVVAHNRGWTPETGDAAQRSGIGPREAGEVFVREIPYTHAGFPSEVLFDVAVPVVLENSEELWGTVRIGYSLQAIGLAVRNLVLISILIAAGVLAVGAMLIEILSRHVSRPLEELLVGAAKIAQGDYSMKLEVRRRDEVGALAYEFNRMAVEIEREQSELENANHLLEGKVSEVTREKAKLAAILRNVIDGLLVIDMNQRLVLANPAAEEMLQFDAAHSAGRAIGEVIRDERLLSALDRTLHGGVGIEEDLSLPASGEAPARIMHTRTALMRGGSGQLRGTVAILQDVTKLRMAEQAKTQFVSNVSHELRTPISIMKVGLSNLLRYRDIAQAEQRSLLETISKENSRLEVLISDLLDISCIEAGSFTLRRSRFDLREVVIDVVESLKGRAEAARLDVSTGLPVDPLMVHADKRRVRQVLMNLVSNAIKYTTNGHVRVSCRACDRESEEGMEIGSAVASIDVEDSGIGIPPDVLQHVFERFFRGHAAELQVPGTGLGLAIVKEIVEAHGGIVRAKSQVREGSVFTVLIPIRSRLAAPVTPRREA